MDEDLKDYAEIRLDKLRRIRYGWGELRELSRRLNGATFAQIIDRLTDPEVLTVALLVGLRGEPDLRRAGPEKIDELLDAFFKREGDDAGLGALLSAVTEAIQAHGVLRSRRRDDAPRPQ